MRKLIILISLILFCELNNSTEASTTIKIKGISCNYTVELPTNWDTIPRETLTAKFENVMYDIGLYNKKNNGYFEGEFVQCLFLSTLKPLNQLTFEQISKELKNSLDFENKQPQKVGCSILCPLILDIFIQSYNT